MQVRGIATAFDSDSHIDSDFTTCKDNCKAFLNTLGFPIPTGSIEQYDLGENEPFSRVYLKEIATIL